MRQAPAQSSNSDGIATGEKAVIDSMEKLTDAIGKLIDTERSPRGRRDSSSQSPQPRTAPPTTRPAPQAQPNSQTRRSSSVRWAACYQHS